MPYSADFIADLDRTISQARLTRYLAATGGDRDAALQLYEKNVLLSGDLFGFLHGVEVTVRNSMHYALSRDLNRQDWYSHRLPLPWPAPSPPRLEFSSSMRKIIEKGREKAGPNAPVGKLISELTFGFWPGMIGNTYEDLWRHSLHKAFPHSSARRQIIHWRLETIRFLRNRIAHHEPVLSSTNDLYTGRPQQMKIRLPDILECVAWVSPSSATWLRSTSRYDEAVALLAATAASGIVL